MKKVLSSVGIDERRIKMGFCSAAEGQKFQLEAIEFDKLIRELGPSPLRPKSSTRKQEVKA
ncbi:MAG: hydrogenase iron-sulfur subunit [Promethearchaeota archaeon]